MAFIIRNKTVSAIDIDDMGIRLRASGDRDITIEGLGEIFGSSDLEGFVQAGDIVVMDQDGATELNAADSLTATTGSGALGIGGGEIANETVAFDASTPVVIATIDTFVDVPGATLDLTTTETGYVTAFAQFNGLCPTAGNTEFHTRLLINDVEMCASIMHRFEATNKRGKYCHGISTTALAAGTYTVKLQFANTEGTDDGTCENLCLTAWSMAAPAGASGADGADGATGATGAGSNVIIQEEGVNIANTPHSTLNIIGDNVTATDAGSGVTDITISGGNTVEFDRQGVATATNLSTSSTSDIDVTNSTLTTKDLGGVGDYLISFSCEYQSEKNDKAAIFSVNVGGVNAYEMRGVGVEDKGDNWLNFSLTHLEQAVPDSTVIKIQVRSESGDAIEVEKRQLTIDGVLSTNVLP